MKIVSELVGLVVISFVLMAIPVLCSLSFAYNWFGGLKFGLVIACLFEWVGLMSWLSNMFDMFDKQN